MTTALLPLLTGGLHVIVEGWRIQLVPLYVLAALILFIRLPAILGREGEIRRRRGLVMSVVTAFTVIGGGIVAGWLMPVITLPAPTGPYPVGIVDRELVDEERGRRLMVSVWYPAAARGTPAPLTHYPDAVTTALGNLAGLPGVVFQQMGYVTLAASQDVPMAAEDAPFPVLIFSHGLVGLRLQNSSTLQELASWGYVVVALDHTDAAAVTVFPDGETSFYDLAKFAVPSDVEPDITMMDEHVFPAWIADQRFVYDTLEQWAQDDPLLAGQLDLERIGSFGHSFGGATAVEVCRVDNRCRASVNMDGGLYGETATLHAVRPLLLMTSAESAQYMEAVDKWTSMIDNADAPAYWLELPNSTHFSFTITQLLSPLLAPDNFDPRGGLSVVDKYLRAFFDRHLRGVETLPLGSASAETDVRWISG
jgi:predicted dienelactone hydrolase